MSALSKLPSLPALFLAVGPLFAAEGPAAPQGPQPLRYQAVSIGNGRVLVIDTATGRCWSKSLGEGKWRDEGNPVTTAGAVAAAIPPQPPAVEAGPTDVLLFTQRSSTWVPGTEGALTAKIGDITDGQVPVSVVDESGKVLAGPKSLSPDQVLTFESADGRTYTITVRSLQNNLVGEDFAILRFASAPTADSTIPASEPKRGSGPAPDPLAPDPLAPDPAAEARKIEALIRHVEGMTDAKFVRNGIEYDGPTAAAFLRGKWDANRAEIETAADFIDKAATASSTSGQPYLIRLKDGTETKAADYLRAELDRLSNLPPR